MIKAVEATKEEVDMLGFHIELTATRLGMRMIYVM